MTLGRAGSRFLAGEALASPFLVGVLRCLAWGAWCSESLPLTPASMSSGSSSFTLRLPMAAARPGVLTRGKYLHPETGCLEFKAGADAESQRAMHRGTQYCHSSAFGCLQQCKSGCAAMPQRNAHTQQTQICRASLLVCPLSIFSVIPARVGVLLFEQFIFRPYSSTKPTASIFQ